MFSSDDCFPFFLNSKFKVKGIQVKEIHPSVGDIGTFNIALAVQLGDVDLAIMLQFFINTISAHKRLGRNDKEGRTWNFCSRHELTSYFPYWNEDKIKRKLKNLIDAGILMVGNFNKRQWDKTNWYAFVDEAKWGISNIPYVGRNRPMDRAESPNGLGDSAQPIPQTKTQTYPPIYKVNEAASPSVTPSIDGKKSLFKGKVKFTDEQAAAFEWLKSLGLDTAEDTLSWWARTYGLARLEEVHKEAKGRRPKSLGAYMQNLLKKGAVVSAGRVEMNHQFAQEFKAAQSWGSLEIHKKYAIINQGNITVEIDFNQEPLSFAKYLMEKHDVFGSK